MYGFSGDQSENFKAAVNAWAQKEGITVKFSSTPDFDKLIRSRVAGNNLPDIAIFPQPGITLDIARVREDDRPQHGARQRRVQQGEDVPASTRRPTTDGKVVRRPDVDQRQEPGLVPEEGVRGGRLHDPEDPGGAARPDRQDQGGRHDAVVRRDREPGRDRLAGDRLDGGLRPALRRRRQVQAVGQARDPVQRPGGQAGRWTRSARSGSPRATSSAAGSRSRAPTSPPRATRCSTTRRSASCTARRASSRSRATSRTTVVADIDNQAGVFPLPPIEAGSGQPIMGAGDLAGLFNKEENTVKVLKYITGHEIGETLAPKGGFISAAGRTSTSRSTRTRRCGPSPKIAYASTDAVFDGSDSMPGEVGSGSFWRGMVAWATGQKDTDTVLSEIDEELAAELAARRPGGRAAPPTRHSLDPAPVAREERSWSVTIKILNALISIIAGVGGALLLYCLLNKLAETLPGRWEDRVKPYVYIVPGDRRDRAVPDLPGDPDDHLQLRQPGLHRVGRASTNYTELLTSPDVPADAVQHPAVDRRSCRRPRSSWAWASRCWPTGCGRAVRSSTKTLIFLPMAISMVGAATIWRFVYEARPAGPAADRPAERDRHRARVRPGRLAAAGDRSTSTASC